MNGAQGAQSLPQGMPQGGNFPQGGPPGGFTGPGGRMFLGGPLMSIGTTLLLVVTLAVLAVAFWQILRKAGFTPAIGLLMLLPIVNLGVALYVAFTDWPVLAELQRLKLVAASVPVAATASAARPPESTPAETVAPVSSAEGLPQA